MRLKKGVVCVKRIYLWLLFLVLLIAPCVSVRAETIYRNGYSFQDKKMYQAKLNYEDDIRQDWGNYDSRYAGYNGWFNCDKRATTGIRWYTKGYVPTKNKIGVSNTLPSGNDWILGQTDGVQKWNDFEIKSNAHYKSYTHTLYLISMDKVQKWMNKNNVKAVDGIRTMYIQPLFDTKHNGVKQNHTFRNLYGIKSAEEWSWETKNGFWNHYNKELKFKTEAKVKVQYQTLEAGDGYPKGELLSPTTGGHGDDDRTAQPKEVKIGEGKKYSLKSSVFNDAGMYETIDTNFGTDRAPDIRHFVLAGIEITRGKENNKELKLGAKGKYQISTSKDYLKKNVVKNSSKPVKMDKKQKLYVNTDKWEKGKIQYIPKSVEIKKDSSDVYDELKAIKDFDFYNGATITFKYVEVQQQPITVEVQRWFYVGKRKGAVNGYYKEPSSVKKKFTSNSADLYYSAGDDETYGEVVIKSNQNQEKLTTDRDVGVTIYDSPINEGAQWDLKKIKVEGKPGGKIRAFTINPIKEVVAGKSYSLKSLNLAGYKEKGIKTVRLNFYYVCKSINAKLYYFQDGLGRYHLFKQQMVYANSKGKIKTQDLGTKYIGGVNTDANKSTFADVFNLKYWEVSSKKKNANSNTEYKTAQTSAWKMDQIWGVEFSRKMASKIEKTDEADNTKEAYLSKVNRQLLLTDTSINNAVYEPEAFKKLGQKSFTNECGNKGPSGFWYNYIPLDNDDATSKEIGSFLFLDDEAGIDSITPTGANSNLAPETDKEVKNVEKNSSKGGTYKLEYKSEGYANATVAVYREKPTVAVYSVARVPILNKNNAITGWKYKKIEAKHEDSSSSETFSEVIGAGDDAITYNYEYGNIVHYHLTSEDRRTYDQTMLKNQDGNSPNMKYTYKTNGKTYKFGLQKIYCFNDSKARTIASKNGVLKDEDLSSDYELHDGDTVYNNADNYITIVKVYTTDLPYYKASYADIEDGNVIHGKLNSRLNTLKRIGDCEEEEFLDRNALQDGTNKVIFGASKRYKRSGYLGVTNPGKEPFVLTNIGILKTGENLGDVDSNTGKKKVYKYAPETVIGGYSGFGSFANKIKWMVNTNANAPSSTAKNSNDHSVSNYLESNGTIKNTPDYNGVHEYLKANRAI